MSSPLEKQTEILNNLLQIMHNSVNSYYEYLDCTFDYFKDEGHIKIVPLDIEKELLSKFQI